ncbi:MAG TPA: MBL fold metallo-hydrolase [Baekduia sp.]|nr:MBL fold metallo-hydrolase [Baekduia sp.]
MARSVYWQTTCTLLHDGEETFIVDSPVFPDELEALPAILQQAGWGLSGLLATHGDWDHLLARTVFPEASLGVAETTAARLRAEPGAAQRELRTADEELYVQRKPLSLGEVQALPVPGKLELGDTELELHPATGHTVDGMAVWAPFAGVLCSGDYLSPVEIPLVEDSPSNYLTTLRVLEPLVAKAKWVVPGHGSPLDAARAAAILREDIAYVEALATAPDAAKLPIARSDRRQKQLHRENLARLN